MRKLRKKGEVFVGAEGTYLITSNGHFREKYELLLADEYYQTKEDGRICLEFRLLNSYQFKAEAIEVMEKRESAYQNSERHLTDLLQSGLITYEEFKERFYDGKGKNADLFDFETVLINKDMIEEQD